MIFCGRFVHNIKNSYILQKKLLFNQTFQKDIVFLHSIYVSSNKTFISYERVIVMHGWLCYFSELQFITKEVFVQR